MATRSSSSRLLLRRIGENTCTCHLSPVTYHLPPVTFHLPRVEMNAKIVELADSPAASTARIVTEIKKVETPDTWHLISDTWHLISYIWLTTDTWHLPPDT